MRCATRRDKRAGHERCAVQYPGLTGRVGRRSSEGIGGGAKRHEHISRSAHSRTSVVYVKMRIESRTARSSRTSSLEAANERWVRNTWRCPLTSRI